VLGLSLIVVAAITISAFFCEYVDSALGMGYGTIMSPLLLVFGFSPMQVVPAILLSELVTGLLAGFMHQSKGNVNFRPKTLSLSRMKTSLKDVGWQGSFKKGIPLHLKVALLLVACSCLGAVLAVFIAKTIPRSWTQLYIGLIVIAMGLTILICLNRNFKFSWFKIGTLGLIASFNKGLTGGGYGPIIVSGQILSGVEAKNAIGITSLAEGLTCVVGVATYFLTARDSVDWKLAPIIILGAVLSVPLAVKSVKIMNPRALKLLIAIFSLILGTMAILKTLRSGL